MIPLSPRNWYPSSQNSKIQATKLSLCIKFPSNFTEDEPHKTVWLGVIPV